MSVVITLVIVAAAIALGIAMAYLPMRLLVAQIGRNITAPIREFIQRRRDRRVASRETPDRRKVAD